MTLAFKKNAAVLYGRLLRGRLAPRLVHRHFAGRAWRTGLAITAPAAYWADAMPVISARARLRHDASQTTGRMARLPCLELSPAKHAPSPGRRRRFRGLATWLADARFAYAQHLTQATSTAGHVAQFSGDMSLARCDPNRATMLQPAAMQIALRRRLRQPLPLRHPLCQCTKHATSAKTSSKLLPGGRKRTPTRPRQRRHAPIARLRLGVRLAPLLTAAETAAAGRVAAPGCGSPTRVTGLTVKRMVTAPRANGYRPRVAGGNVDVHVREPQFASRFPGRRRRPNAQTEKLWTPTRQLRRPRQRQPHGVKGSGIRSRSTDMQPLMRKHGLNGAQLAASL